jgi:hypothetical protein
MLALNADDFAGKPLTNDPTNQNSQIWTGTMSNGDTIVGLFNRETTAQTRSLVQRHRTRGYGQRERLVAAGRPGPMSSVSMELPPHGSIVLRLSKGSGTCTPQSSTFNQIADWTYNNPPPAVSASASSGLPVTFEVALGPATVQGNEVAPTGQLGTVYVVAKRVEMARRVLQSHGAIVQRHRATSGQYVPLWHLYELDVYTHAGCWRGVGRGQRIYSSR